MRHKRAEMIYREFPDLARADANRYTNYLSRANAADYRKQKKAARRQAPINRRIKEFHTKAGDSDCNKLIPYNRATQWMKSVGRDDCSVCKQSRADHDAYQDPDIDWSWSVCQTVGADINGNKSKRLVGGAVTGAGVWKGVLLWCINTLRCSGWMTWMDEPRYGHNMGLLRGFDWVTQPVQYLYLIGPPAGC